MPMDLVAAASARAELGAPLPAQAWIEPIADRLVMPYDGDPADLAETRESIRLAFIATLQHLLPRQRAVLLLRDVVGLRAAEVAGMLNSSVPAVHSMLRRARAVLAAADLDAKVPAEPNRLHHELLIRYINAFERFDIDALVALVHEDITLSMPPHPLWLHGRDDFRRWMRKTADHCRDARLVAIRVNGSPAAAVYRPGHLDEPLEPSAIHVLEPLGHRIAAIHAFLDPDLFPVLRLPSH
jgi:RNA polymerase sigma-70 factor (ECF subfamily)